MKQIAKLLEEIFMEKKMDEPYRLKAGKICDVEKTFLEGLSEEKKQLYVNLDRLKDDLEYDYRVALLDFTLAFVGNFLEDIFADKRQVVE